MNKRVIIIFFAIGLAIVFIYGIYSFMCSEYILEEVKTAEWKFTGGYISVNGNTKMDGYNGLEYIGEESKVVNKISVDLRSYDLFNLKKYDSISLSSVEDTEGILLVEGFDYGGGNGRSSSSGILDSRFIYKVEMIVVIETNDLDEEVKIKIPITRN